MKEDKNEKTESEAKLTPEQKIFVREYLINGHNGYQAAIAAGYCEDTARNAHKIKNSPRVKEEMNFQLKRFMRRYDLTTDRVFDELSCVAFLDIADFYDEDGEILPIHKMPERARRAIAGLDIEQLFEKNGREKFLIGHLKKFKTNNKLDAIKEINKMKGWYADKKVELKGNLNHDHKHKVDEVDLEDRIKQLIQEELGDALQ